MEKKMEMILSFTDKNEHEIQKFKRAITADNAYHVLSLIDDWFRNQVKFNNLNCSKSQQEILEKVWRENILHFLEGVDMTFWT